jgi:predicted ArsR family transcriptional regulator
MRKSEKQEDARNDRLETGRRILELIGARKSPLPIADIASALSCTREALQESLDGLVGDGALMLTRK